MQVYYVPPAWDTCGNTGVGVGPGVGTGDDSGGSPQEVVGFHSITWDVFWQPSLHSSFERGPGGMEWEPSQNCFSGTTAWKSIPWPTQIAGHSVFQKQFSSGVSSWNKRRWVGLRPACVRLSSLGRAWTRGLGGTWLLSTAWGLCCYNLLVPLPRPPHFLTSIRKQNCA